MSFYPGQLQWSVVDRLHAENKRLRDENEKLVRALWFYADPYPNVSLDDGRRAGEALLAVGVDPPELDEDDV